ncbi:hypothetical protein BDA99DRAFT_517562 [Phascolomyces articulosus]|uniref:Uncharacterized protein n=1 Tax=Phascolomyces articulosus TaxID=60185 RepID=A0AAD5K5T7_9FUNG|nr:hypothetical protein BDA99DRAFT_517562 [Phascolomyces articulosus]
MYIYLLYALLYSPQCFMFVLPRPLIFTHKMNIAKPIIPISCHKLVLIFFIIMIYMITL